MRRSPPGKPGAIYRARYSYSPHPMPRRRSLPLNPPRWWPWAALGVVALAIVASWLSGPAAATGPHPVGVDHYRPLIERYADRHALDRELVVAVVTAESGGDPEAVSPVGARGLMQIMPIAHREATDRLGVDEGNLHDPEHNVAVGTAYLAHLMDRFDDDRVLAVAAYHMGPTRVAKLRREHPALTSRELIRRHAGPQTRAYVERVLGPTAAGG